MLTTASQISGVPIISASTLLLTCRPYLPSCSLLINPNPKFHCCGSVFPPEKRNRQHPKSRLRSDNSDFEFMDTSTFNF